MEDYNNTEHNGDIFHGFPHSDKASKEREIALDIKSCRHIFDKTGGEFMTMGTRLPLAILTNVVEAVDRAYLFQATSLDLEVVRLWNRIQNCYSSLDVLRAKREYIKVASSYVDDRICFGREAPLDPCLSQYMSTVAQSSWNSMRRVTPCEGRRILRVSKASSPFKYSLQRTTSHMAYV